MQELPDPILDDIAFHKPVEQHRPSFEPQDNLDAMKIAWRYQNLPKVQVIRWFNTALIKVIMILLLKVQHVTLLRME